MNATRRTPPKSIANRPRLHLHVSRLNLATAVAQQTDSPNQGLPPALVRRYEVLITPRGSAKPLKMREVQSASIGRLVTVRVRLSSCCAGACSSVIVIATLPVAVMSADLTRVVARLPGLPAKRCSMGSGGAAFLRRRAL
jgi:hypothetical protein